MREPATKYLIIQDPFEQTVLAFMSWQVDIEEDDIVVYWYDILNSVLMTVTSCNCTIDFNDKA